MILASRLSRSLKVFGTNTDRSATCDFLLKFHINKGPISRIVSEINDDFSRKSQIFPTPVNLTPPMKGFPLELSIGA